jgi:hypothetical protein
VLDASYPIRQLCRLDPTLTPAGRFSDAEVKRFDHVTIRQMFAASGRHSVARSFQQARREKRAVSLEVAEVVKKIPADEAILIFTFKSPQDSIRRILLDDLKAAGVDVQAKTTSGKDRINVLTWGNETSLNDFAHCGHVILAGVLHRSLLDLASVAVGQLDDREAQLDGQWLLELMRSEVAHCVYQAISRGSCREVDLGQAKPMTAYVILPWPLQPYLGPVMPGLKHEVWVPAHGGICDGAAMRTALAILDYLRKLPEETRKVPTRHIREVLGIPGGQARAFRRAVEQLGELCEEWTREGHSLVRSAGPFGFAAEA